MAMYVSDALVNWLIDEGHCVPDGSKEYYGTNASQLLFEGLLDNKTYEALSDESEEFDDRPAGIKSQTDDDDQEEDDDAISPSEMKSIFRRMDEAIDELKEVLTQPEDSDMSAEKLFEGRKGGSITVKKASAQYSEKTYVVHNKRGQSVIDPYRKSECQTQSEAAAARAGVLLKHAAAKAGISTAVLSEHERSVLADVCMQKEWAGNVGSEYIDVITGGSGVKALIDDQISGGLEITPIEFDSDVITFPLLNGELFPDVDLKSLPRGRRVESASIGNLSLAWGGYDDTAIDLFNTSALVNAIDTTIHVVQGAILIGRDFLSDSPVVVGQTLTQLIGEKLSQQLDYVIGSGNGTTQPEGIFTKAGVTTIGVDYNNSGPPTLNDFMSLMFSIGKQYRRSAFKPVFLTNDVSYQRSRAMKIDTASPSTDSRPVLDPLVQNFGAGANAYQTLGWPHRIQNDLSNKYGAFVCLQKYRMYRRAGLELRWTQEGQTLARNNEILLTYRARFGGKLMDASACAKWLTGQN